MQIYHWMNKTKERFYNITVQKDGTYTVLNYHWGSCITNRRRKKDLLCETEKEAQEIISKMIKRRKSRGYQLISPKY